MTRNNTPLLDAAEQLLAGNPDFTMNELGTAVHLSRATLYRQIGSIEALLQRPLAVPVAYQGESPRPFPPK